MEQACWWSPQLARDMNSGHEFLVFDVSVDVIVGVILIVIVIRNLIIGLWRRPAARPVNAEDSDQDQDQDHV